MSCWAVGLALPHPAWGPASLPPSPCAPICPQAIFRALDQVRQRPWYQECQTEVLLYRGAWQVGCC